MKILLKWAGLFVLPSMVLFPFLYADLLDTAPEKKALFMTLHYLFAGAAIYFCLMEVKKKSVETPSGLRYIITGVLTAVTHGIIFGLYSGFYFNVFKTDQKQLYTEHVLEKAVILNRDSTAGSMEEYYHNLMQGKDSGVLLPEVYEQYKKAASDSVYRAKNEVRAFSEQSFGFYWVTLRWTGFAFFIGILFSVIVTVFAVRR